MTLSQAPMRICRWLLLMERRCNAAVIVIVLVALVPLCCRLVRRLSASHDERMAAGTILVDLTAERNCCNALLQYAVPVHAHALHTLSSRPSLCLPTSICMRAMSRLQTRTRQSRVQSGGNPTAESVRCSATKARGGAGCR